jgi:hypothetical protein
MLTVDMVAAALCAVVIVYAFWLGARLEKLFRDIDKRR